VCAQLGGHSRTPVWRSGRGAIRGVTQSRGLLCEPFVGSGSEALPSMGAIFGLEERCTQQR
jgi:hypothetical protein